MPDRDPVQFSPAGVLVVGGGGAALRAALAASEAAPDLDVTLVCKGALGASGVTATACSDRMAFHATLPQTAPGGPGAWRYHADDIYRIGGLVSDADLAAILAHDSYEAFAYLDALGVPWVRRADGSVDQFYTDGSVYPRACYTGPFTANDIEAALLARLRETRVRVLEHWMVAELLRDASGRVTGAALVSQADQGLGVIGASAVVLATGGAGRVFGTSVFPPDCTGDGYAMAYRAGAELVNMEFIQIGLCSPATGLACSGSMMRALPRLVDETGREFLPEHMPGTTPAERHAVLFAKGASWPVSQRDPSHRIDIAVAREIARGHRVYLDYSRDPGDLDLAALPEATRERLAREKGAPLEAADTATPLARLLAINRPSVAWLAERGVDLIAGNPLEIAPAVQHFQGGIKIRTRAETRVPGLYAAGETAGGQHGANRPGGNALLDGQVFGRIAGLSAAADAGAHRAGGPATPAMAQAAVKALLTPGGAPADGVLAVIRHAMDEACGVCRTAQGLGALADRLSALTARGVSPAEGTLCTAIEAVNALQVARAIRLAASLRDESRGPHLRFDADSPDPLPPDDTRWQRYIAIHAAGEAPVAETREPVRPAQP